MTLANRRTEQNGIRNTGDILAGLNITDNHSSKTISLESNSCEVGEYSLETPTTAVPKSAYDHGFEYHSKGDSDHDSFKTDSSTPTLSEASTFVEPKLQQAPEKALKQFQEALELSASTTTSDTASESDTYGGGAFEGPEKLLEIWFKSSNNSTKKGLRVVSRKVWQDMLDLVHCQILNVVSNDFFDTYLLSESSLFVFPHKLILKTCGTTTLLYAVQRILDIGRELCGLDQVSRVFYSRKTFMFPDKQPGPHKSWEDEVEYLDNHFENGAAYLIGKQNEDHWHLYMATGQSSLENAQQQEEEEDVTVEILMTGLNQDRVHGLYLENQPANVKEGTEGGAIVAKQLGLADIYPDAILDSYLFSPCGFSMNGLQDGQYITVHVTPEPECSYASYETNIRPKNNASTVTTKQVHRLVRKVVAAFDPEHVTVTLFKSRPSSSHQTSSLFADGNPLVDNDNSSDEEESAYRAKQIVDQPCNVPCIPGYKTKDRILYELEGYWLRYAYFSRSTN